MNQKRLVAGKKLPHKKIVHFCGGCVKGECFSPNDGLSVWQHLKSYRLDDKIRHEVLLVQATCLGVCAGGPIVQVSDQNGIVQYCLRSGNIEEANHVIDRIMAEHVLGGVPIREFLDTREKASV